MAPLVYLKTIAVALTILLLVHCLAFFSQLGAPFPVAYWVRDFTIIKTHLLMSAKTSKLVIVGGSSTLYGFSSWLLAEKLQLIPVNFGTYGAWPLEHILASVKPFLYKGDVVLLPLEYEYYTRTTPYWWPFTSNVMNYEVHYFWSLNLREKIAFMASVPGNRILGGVISLVFDRKVRRLEESRSLQNSDVVKAWQEARSQVAVPEEYGFKLLNQYGDYDFSFTKQYDGRAIYAVMNPFTYSPYAWTVLSDFIQWSASHGVRVYATWPPSVKDPQMDFGRSTERAHTNAIVRHYCNLGVQVLGEPQDFQLERDLFGDSVYHLRGEGRFIRTLRVANLLADALNSQSTEIHGKPSVCSLS